jgi:putative effector of murein hydrolase
VSVAAVPLWKKFWLLFSVMWVVVAGLHVATILAFADEIEHGRALYSAAFAVLVPAAAYLIGWAWERIKK